jgi:hypothetical protein
MLMASAHIVKGGLRDAATHLQMAITLKAAKGDIEAASTEIDTTSLMQKHAVFVYLLKESAAGDANATQLLEKSYEAFSESFDGVENLHIDVVELLKMLNTLILYECNTEKYEQAKIHIEEYKNLCKSFSDDLSRSGMLYVLNIELELFLNDQLSEKETEKWLEDLSETAFKYLKIWHRSASEPEAEAMLLVLSRLINQTLCKMLFQTPDFDDFTDVAQKMADTFESIAEAADDPKFAKLMLGANIASLYYGAINAGFDRAHTGIKAVLDNVAENLSEDFGESCTQLTAITYVYEMLIGDFSAVSEDPGLRDFPVGADKARLEKYFAKHQIRCVADLAKAGGNARWNSSEAEFTSEMFAGICHQLAKAYDCAYDGFGPAIVLAPPQEHEGIAFDYAQLLISRKQLLSRMHEVNADIRIGAQIDEIGAVIKKLNLKYKIDVFDPEDSD